MRIRDVNLDDHPKYKALSYVWGDASVTLPILVNEKRYYVTTNCHAALHRLRGVGETCLWIDAICINQKDNEEKGTQIPLMRDIYSMAEEVTVWLGRSEAERRPEDKSNEDLAFALMKDLERGLEGFVDFDKANKLFRGLMRGENPHRRWVALEELFSHPWFERLWVYQELLVSSTATALCQYRSEPFTLIQYMGLALQELLRGGGLPESVPFFYDENRAIRQRLVAGCQRVMVRATQQRQYNSAEKSLARISLSDLLEVNRMYRCTDPRDHVFAILGFVKDGRLRRVRVDYSQSVAEVYASVTRSFIEEDKSLQILGLARSESLDTSDSARLPSWVANLSAGSGKQLSPLMQKFYEATLGTTPQVSLCDNSLIMEVRGFHVDTIAILNYLDFHENSLRWLKGAIGLPDWQERFSVYPTGCDPREAYIRTITTDLGKYSGQPSRLSSATLRQYHALSRLEDVPVEEWKRTFARSLENNISERQTEMLEREATRIFAEYTQRASEYFNGRVFFISNLGYMGLGPPAARKDDVVCLLPGCKVLLLIRKEDDNHVLVGECFVWGLMDGEAMKDRKEDDEFELFRLR